MVMDSRSRKPLQRASMGAGVDTQIHRVVWDGWSQVRETTPGSTFEVNQAVSTAFAQEGVSDDRIVVVEFDEATGLSIPNGGKAWLNVGKPAWEIQDNDGGAGAKSMTAECNIWFIKEAFDYTSVTWTSYAALSKVKVQRWVSRYNQPGGGASGAWASRQPGDDELMFAMFLLPGDKIFSADTYYGFAVQLAITAFAGTTFPFTQLQFYPENYNTNGGSHMDVINSVSTLIDTPGVYRTEPV